MSQKIRDRIIHFSETHSTVHFVVFVLGNYDLQLEVEVNNYRELDSLLRDFRNEFAYHVQNLDTLRVLREYKYDFFPFEVK